MKELETLVCISQISGNGSAKKKAELLANCATDDMKWLLDISSNPFRTTKVSKLALHETTSRTGSFEKIKERIEVLLQSKAAKGEDRAYLEDQISSLQIPFSQKEMLVKVLTKNLNIGIGISTINKVFGSSFIPDLELMAAQDDIDSFNVHEEHAAEVKYDGIRVIAVEHRDSVEFYTRNFNNLQCSFMPKIEKECSRLIKSIKEQFSFAGKIFLDGELTDKNRKSASGKVNQMLKGKGTDPLDEDLLFNVFDIEEFSVIQQKGKGTLQYAQRRQMIDETLDDTYSHLVKAQMHLSNSYDETNKLFYDVVAKGGEGLIVKDIFAVYECKRSKSWIKLKEVNDCDLKIVGHFPGENRRADNGWIGGFFCETSDGQLKVKVGSGFTDEVLSEISANQDSYIGKIAKVQYNTRIQDKSGNWSLFLPVFLEVRTDKDTADSLEKVK